MQHIQVPNFEFSGPHKDPNLVAGATNYLETRTVELPPELPISQERSEKLEAMNASLLAYGESLGLDLTTRLTPQSRIHFMDSAGMETMYQRYPHQRGALGLRLTSNDIIALEFPADEENQSLSFIQHEKIHNLAHHDIELLPDSDGNWGVEERKSGWGYFNGVMDGIDEYLTERINREVINNYWPQDPHLKDMVDFKPSKFMPDLPPEMTYDTLMAFGDAWAQRLTETMGPDIMTDVERSYFTGDAGIQHIIDDAIGNEHMLALSGLHTHLPQHVGETAAKLAINFEPPKRK